MSVITEVIICFYSKGPDKDDEVRIVKINELIGNHPPFQDVKHMAGGGKVFCSNLLIGAFNYFCTHQFIEDLKNLDWNNFYFCWIMTQEEQCPWGEKIWIKEDHSQD